MMVFRRVWMMVLTMVLVVVWMGCAVASPAAAAADGFVLQDHLNRTWSNELVRFALSEADRGKARAGHALLGPDGKTVPYQLTADGIAFAADLDPLQSRTYRFGEAAAAAGSDLVVEQTAQVIRIANAQAGIELRKSIDAEHGPIQRVRLRSGPWIGGSRFQSSRGVASYRAEVTARGPVFVEVTCRAEFAEGKSWTAVFHLQAGEPVVLVNETYALDDDSQWLLSLGRDFAPRQVMYRSSAAVKVEALAEEEGSLLFELRPWSVWGPPRLGKWCGLFHDGGDDLLLLGARDGDVWVDLRDPIDAAVPIRRQGGDVVASFSMRSGQRRWMIGSVSRPQSVADVGKPVAPLPQQWVIKHEFPLDRVKDYVLDWPQGNEAHPRLYVTPTDVAKLRQTYQPSAEELAKLTATAVNVYQMDPWIRAYAASGDAGLGRHLTQKALDTLQAAADIQLRQAALASFGWAPHGQGDILLGLSLADIVMSGDAATPQQKQRLRALAAFLGYTVMRADYWSPLRGFGANPNMTSHVACYQVALGCFLPSHPQSRRWVQEGLRELKDVELETWSDANGGWIEAPGYALVSYNYILGALVMARNGGYGDHVQHPQLKKVLLWLAKLSTPPDSRLLNTRHLQPLGDTWKLAWVGEFALAAALWKQSDPQLAANLLWLHQQHNSYTQKVGGFCAVMAGYRDWLSDTADITPQPPAFASELFPLTGAVLRHHFPSARETTLYLVAGEHCHHYSFEYGSVYLWGKGRILCDKFGYYGRPPAADHNMLDVPLLNNTLMLVRQFATTDGLDYVRCSSAGASPPDLRRLTPVSHLDYQHSVYNVWTRQIAFMKDVDPLGPNYFVIHDSLRSPIPAVWRMWFEAQQVQVHSQGALVVGKDDVDTDIYFATPAGVTLSTESKTRSTHGYNAEGKYGRTDWTQIGLIAQQDSATNYHAVIYPRLKTQAPPRFSTPLQPPAPPGDSAGNVFRVETEAGVDYVFLSPKPFTFKQDGLEFEGTIGAVQQRGQRLTLSLGAAGRIAAHGRTLNADTAASRTW